MKIQIDTIAKTLKVEQDVKLEELIIALDKLLPGEWKNFTLQTNVNWNWVSPIVITPQYPRPYWQNPWYGLKALDIDHESNRVDVMESSGQIGASLSFSSPPNKLKAGVFNVEYQAQN